MTSKQRKQRRLRDAHAAGTSPSQLRRDRASARRVAASLSDYAPSVFGWAESVMLESTAKGVTGYPRVWGATEPTPMFTPHYMHVSVTMHMTEIKVVSWPRPPRRRRYRTR